MTNLYCVRCGTPTIPGERFCGECGNDLTVSGAVTTVPRGGANVPPNPPVYPAQSGFGPPPATTAPFAASQTAVTPTRRGCLSVNIAVSIMAVVAVLLVGSGIFLLNNNGGNNNQPVANSSTPPVAAGSGSNNSPSPGGVLASASATPALAAATAAVGGTPNDPALVKEVNDAVTGMRALDSFHAKISGAYGGNDLLLEGDFSKQAARFSVTAAGHSYNVVFVGSAEYVSSDAGKSWQVSSSFDGIKSLTNLFDNDVLTPGSSVSDQGNETLAQGATAHKVFINDTTTNDQITLWLVSDNSSALIYRLRGVYNNSSDTSYDLTINYSNFNAPLNIQAPSIGD